MEIPSEIRNKIMRFNSHPVADVMRFEIDDCIQSYIPLNNDYEYEYGGEESFVLCYFKWRSWLKLKDDED